MGFFTGRVSFLRFAVNGPAPGMFGDEHLDRLREHRAGHSPVAAADRVEAGWAAGKSVLDLDFTLEKNIINDCLVFDLRVDTDRLPGDLLKAYYEADVTALARENPSGFASTKQKREAKESALDRLEQEAKDGRFKRRKCTPVLWDRHSNEVLLGATSPSQADRLCDLFSRTFGLDLRLVSAGGRAELLASAAGLTGAADGPSGFVGEADGEVAWVVNGGPADYLGNEFLLWLWYRTDRDEDTLQVADGSEVTLMPARTLSLEFPRGIGGTGTLASDGPTRLPEARRAAQSGKLPRKMGLTLVRHGGQYDLALHAETLAVGSCKLPDLPEEVTDARAKLDERAAQLRELIETLDLLYGRFLAVRLSADWPAELARVRRWLTRIEERAA
jgi:hypothetical protein